jgi:hypothetical protein
VSTQLRLVEPPAPKQAATRSAKQTARQQASGRARPAGRRAANLKPTGRRAVAWGDWHLDARTRKVGRAGVASARQALEAAAAARESAPELSQAS